MLTHPPPVLKGPRSHCRGFRRSPSAEGGRPEQPPATRLHRRGWHDGIEQDFHIPEVMRKLYPGKRFPEEAALWIGENSALLLPHGIGPQLLPREQFENVKRPEVKGDNHYHGIINSILDGTPLESPFEISGPMSEAVILGTVAVRNPGLRLEWNASALQFTNSTAASSMLRRSYRDGWKIGGLSL